jgi:hypothetical protein
LVILIHRIEVTLRLFHLALAVGKENGVFWAFYLGLQTCCKGWRGMMVNLELFDIITHGCR